MMLNIDAKASLATGRDSGWLGTNFAAQNSEADMGKLLDKRVVMIIAERDFRDEELFQPKAVLEKAGVKVDIASTKIEEAKGKMGARVKPDKLVSDIDIADYDAVVFIGGPGSVQYWDDPLAHALARQAVEKGKVLAAICAAPVTLAKAGVLDAKKATCFPGEAQELRDNGVHYTAKTVEIDGNIVTADGPLSATEFGEALVKKLSQQ